jgi:hypothetical protein
MIYKWPHGSFSALNKEKVKATHERDDKTSTIQPVITFPASSRPVNALHMQLLYHKLAEHYQLDQVDILNAWQVP